MHTAVGNSAHSWRCDRQTSKKPLTRCVDKTMGLALWKMSEMLIITKREIKAFIILGFIRLKYLQIQLITTAMAPFVINNYTVFIIPPGWCVNSVKDIIYKITRVLCVKWKNRSWFPENIYFWLCRCLDRQVEIKSLLLYIYHWIIGWKKNIHSCIHEDI